MAPPLTSAETPPRSYVVKATVRGATLSTIRLASCRLLKRGTRQQTRSAMTSQRAVPFEVQPIPPAEAPQASRIEVQPTAERQRQSDARVHGAPWWRWGPYLSERQWGTVREDYSAGGDAWDSFPHDHARSRAYRWGEDGLLGISDNHGRLCFSIA